MWKFAWPSFALASSKVRGMAQTAKAQLKPQAPRPTATAFCLILGGLVEERLSTIKRSSEGPSPSHERHADHGFSFGPRFGVRTSTRCEWEACNRDFACSHILSPSVLRISCDGFSVSWPWYPELHCTSLSLSEGELIESIRNGAQGVLSQRHREKVVVVVLLLLLLLQQQR